MLFARESNLGKKHLSAFFRSSNGDRGDPEKVGKKLFAILPYRSRLKSVANLTHVGCTNLTHDFSNLSRGRAYGI
jgi:hypothetical protein